MKGLLIAAGVGFRKIHDLDELADAVVPFHPMLSADLDRCRPFTAWSTDYRYPPEDESPPPSREEILEALDILQRLHAAATAG